MSLCLIFALQHFSVVGKIGVLIPGHEIWLSYYIFETCKHEMYITPILLLPFHTISRMLPIKKAKLITSQTEAKSRIKEI
ncbi:hypothetical protein BpHYR1_050075 [Brachionus plicatilis]|uniref:Uncharacterized protein n=1 Tax=Brachionus plicatilis TaxID=10195 RepID=A0A3M7PNZ3_BRAPC|nr:hypothetical protein BpHYR1_050075 [Brachionus plicatilis]